MWMLRTRLEGKKTDQKWPTAMPSRSPMTPWYPLDSAQLNRTKAYGRWPAEMAMTPKSDNLTFEFRRAHRYTSVKLKGADRNGAGDSGDSSCTSQHAQTHFSSDPSYIPNYLSSHQKNHPGLPVTACSKLSVTRRNPPDGRGKYFPPAFSNISCYTKTRIHVSMLSRRRFC